MVDQTARPRIILNKAADETAAGLACPAYHTLTPLPFPLSPLPLPSRYTRTQIEL